jgi:hypothetical protein
LSFAVAAVATILGAVLVSVIVKKILKQLGLALQKVSKAKSCQSTVDA